MKKMEELEVIVRNAKIGLDEIEDNLYNPILKSADYKPREVFYALKKQTQVYFQTRRAARMLGLAGLRGTGKTTLLWETAQFIFTNFTQEIYFFHLGDLKKYDVGIAEIQATFEKYIIKARLNSHRSDIVLLFDEIHESKNWAKDLKVLYDLFPSAFVIATGSSALLLQSTADLVTRMHIQHVFPLSFTEYIDLILLPENESFRHKNQLKEILFHSENIEDLEVALYELNPEILEYFSQIPSLPEQIKDYIEYKNITRFSTWEIKTQINDSIRDLVRRVIYEDIPVLKNDFQVHFSEKILTRFAASDEINLQTLSQSIGISQIEINENLDILVKSELLNVLYPFGGIDTKINKVQKYFFMSPSIRRVILSPLIGIKGYDNLSAKLLEDTVVLYLKRLFTQEAILSFSSQKDGKNPDLIIETLPKPILIEIGISKQASIQITKSKIKYKYAFIVNSKIDEIKINRHEKTIILPLKYFLLL